MASAVAAAPLGDWSKHALEDPPLPPTPQSPPTRQISASAVGKEDCRLVDCGSPSPTYRDRPDAPRLEFGEFQRRARLLADEFFCARDVPGMVASVEALGCPSFHDELVAICLRASLDRNEPERDAVVEFLGALSAAELLSTAQQVRGFEKLVLTFDDLRLDVPSAPNHLAALLAPETGIVTLGFFPRLPEGLLQALADGVAPGALQDAVRAHLEDLRAFKAELAAHLEADLFCMRSVDQLVAWLRGAAKDAFHHEVVLAALVSSLDPNPSPSAYWMSCFSGPALVAEKRRLVLGMLAQLQSVDESFLLDEVDVQLGFSRLLGLVDHLVQTSPENRDFVVALFVGVVEQEQMPAEFLKCARRMRFGGPKGVEVLREAQRQTPMYSRRSWGTGDEQQFRKEVRMAILEYFDSKSIDELAQIVQELHLSEKEQSQFIRKLLVTGMERDETGPALDAVAGLSGFCWFPEDVRSAFEQLRDVARDLVLDLPMCRERTNDLVLEAVRRGILEESYIAYDADTIV